MRAQIFHPAAGLGSAQVVRTLRSPDIPLVHIQPPRLSAASCVKIDQQSSASLTLLGDYAVMENGRVVIDGEVTEAGIPSVLPIVTAVWLGNDPCFWRHRVSRPVYSLAIGGLWRPNVPIKLIGTTGRIVAIPTGETNQYWLDIYLVESVSGAYAVYQGRVDGTDIEIREDLYPLLCSQAGTAEEVAVEPVTGPRICITPFTPIDTRIYSPLRPFADTREKLEIEWRIEIWTGFTQTEVGGWNTVEILASEQLTAEDTNEEGWITLSADPTIEAPRALAGDEYFTVGLQFGAAYEGAVLVEVEPEGLGPAKVRWNSGTDPFDLPDRFNLANEIFTPELAVAGLDQGVPSIGVGGFSLEDPWHIRVQAGRFTQTVSATEYLYALPEFWRDRFYPMPPYALQEERPIRIKSNLFRVRQTPIDQAAAVTASVLVDTEVYLTVIDVDPQTGAIEVAESVPEQAVVLIRYAHRKDYATYRGTADSYLNLNPRQITDMPLAEKTALQPGIRLVSKTVYLYWLPYAVNELPLVPIRDETLLHSFTPVDLDANPTYILLATLEVSIPFGPSSIKRVDARRRGGGLPEGIIIPESMSADVAGYADIGTYDGRELPLAGSYVVEIAPWFPVTDPGQVREQAERSGPFGQLPLVRSIPWPESILLAPEGLVVDTEEDA